MKKHLAAAALTTALIAGPAMADSPYFNPYAGIDYQFASVDFDAPLDDDGFHGANIHIGNRFTRNFGLELGYFRMREESQNLGAATAKAKYHGATLDALGYLPLGEQKSFELIGTAGASYIRAEAEVAAGPVTVKDDSSEAGYRLGAGAQYHVTDDVNLRGIARYQSADFDGTANGAWTYTFGVNYGF